MEFFAKVDEAMRFDPGHRGLLANAPKNPMEKLTDSLKNVTGAVVLTGFPVRLGRGNFAGETDGPLGAANIAFALEAAGVPVWVMTDEEAYWIVLAAMTERGCKSRPMLLPAYETGDFIREQLDALNPSHVITIERPGKARDGHYHNMRGHIIDAMLADTSDIIAEAKKRGMTTISIGDGGNEIGMGGLEEIIKAHVPSGETICAKEKAEIVLISGVSNWWGWGMAAVLSYIHGKNFLPGEAMELGMLQKMLAAGSVDGCTKHSEETVDNLPMEVHFGILAKVRAALQEA